MDNSHLEDILRQCSNRGNVKPSENEKLFENLWKEQEERLSKHEKYISESIEIKPIPIFVCKATMREKNQSIQESKKVFLNICSHHMIPNLSVSQIDVHQNGRKEEGIRFPMSCGPQIPIKDNKGNDASTFDVVFHPDIIKYAMDENNYKLNICTTASQNISQKHDIIIDGPFKFPKAIYKGIDINHKQPLPQRIRKKGAATFVQEDNDKINGLPIEYNTKKERNTDDIKSNDDDKDIKLEYDFYILFADEDRKKLLIKNMDEMNEKLKKLGKKEDILKEIKGIQICIDLTKRFKLNELDLNTNQYGINLKFKQMVLFNIKWNEIRRGMNKFVDCQQIFAKFVKKKCLLKITCPFITDQ